MVIETTRFGSITVPEIDVVTFPEGMLGFSKIDQYVLVEGADVSLFIWLQAIKKGSVAFPLLEPQIFEPSFKIDLMDDDRKVLKMDSLEHAKVFSIVTIPSDPTKMTANLKAPIVLNCKTRLARQVILHNLDYPIRMPIYTQLQRHCSTSSRTIFPEDDVPQYQAVHLADELPDTLTAL